MLRLNNLFIPLEASEADIKRETAEKLHLSANDLQDFKIAKKSVDARNKKNVHFVYSVDFNAENINLKDLDDFFRSVDKLV